jgi:hypothetical protein
MLVLRKPHFLCACRLCLSQVASGRFGVTPEFAVNADQLEIKIAQGAKPGTHVHMNGTAHLCLMIMARSEG